MPLAKSRLFFTRAAICLCFVSILLIGATAESAPVRAYIAPGSELAFAVVTAPLPTRRLGAIAVAASRVLIDPSVVLPPVLGEPGPEPIPPGWPAALPTLHSGPAPLAAQGDGPCNCRTPIGDSRQERVAVLYAGRTFHVGAELFGLRLLHLRLRYQDGLVAYINGREVARRNLAPGHGPMDIAARPHGPEWETFSIPVIAGLLRPGVNVLSVEVHPSGHRLAPALDIELTAGDRARIVRGPMVQRVGPSSATIVFETDLPVAARIEYGSEDGAKLGHTAHSAGGGLAMRHVIELADLPAGSPIHYRVLAGGDFRDGLRFHTAPGPGAITRFAVYGDVRGGHRTHGELIAAITKEAPDFVLVTGDLVLRGSDEADWQRFFTIAGDLIARVPYYPVAGNHDTGRSGDQRRRMNEIFELWPGPANRPEWGHWYSFDAGDIHIVMLDSNAYEHERQRAWLEGDLAAARARGVRAIFAVTHDGPYSRGLHRGNVYAAEHYVPVLARHGVILIFSGHDHLYQRGRVDGVSYMVSGGGGAPLYPVTCGVPGRRRCKTRDGKQHVAKEHHYILVTVYPAHVEACPKRSDASPLEPCITYPLRGQSSAAFHK